MKKHLLLYICLLMALLVCGCGKDKDKEKDKETATTTAPIFNMEQFATQTDPAEENAARMDEDGFFLAHDYVKTMGDTINVRVEPNTEANIYILLGPDEVTSGQELL